MTGVSPDYVLEKAWTDIVTGMAEYFDDGQIEKLPGVAIPDVITQGDFSVVVWRYKGLNTKPINNVQPSVDLGDDQRATVGADATEVNVEGVTIIHHRGADVDSWVFHRFIDWNSVAGQIGFSRGRAATPERLAPVRRSDGPLPGGLPVPPR